MTDPKHLANLLDRKSTKKLQLHDPSLLRIHPPELVKRFIQRQQIDFGLVRELLNGRDRHSLLTGSAALHGLMLARVVHQYAPHQLRGNSEKMGAILPFCISLIDELEIGLVDERGGFECVLGALAPQVVARQPSQLAVDQRHQFFERRLIAVTPLDQKLRYAFRGGPHMCARSRVYNKCFRLVRGSEPNVRVNKWRQTMKKFFNISLAIMMLVGVLVVGAHAQTSSAQKVIASIPFTFNVGKTTLPAGKYTITVLNPTSDRKILQIRSLDGHASAMIQTMTNIVSVSEKAKLVFDRYGDRYVFSQAQLAGDST